MASEAMEVSARVLATDPPVIVKTKQLMAAADPDKPPVLSLAQGVVHWRPPPAATSLAAQMLAQGECSSSGGDSHVQYSAAAAGGMRAVYGAGGVHSYGPAAGLPALVEALRDKVATRNGLTGYDIMVTSGANQAFVNLVLALCDAGDPVVLFRPYYFNHIMALQMTGGAAQVLLGPCSPCTLHPDWTWLQAQLSGPKPPRMVVLVNPCNPTGILLPAEELQAAAAMCAAAGTWLILDNTYEDFVYDDPNTNATATRRHACVAGPNVISVFSFSKAYGMMGWRVGYIAYPGQELLDSSSSSSGVPGCKLGEQLLKIQDTVAICPGQLSQHMALAALQHGGDYVQQAIAGLARHRALIADALSPLGTQGHGWVGGEGAIYYWAKLPDRFGTQPPAAAAAASGDRAEAANPEPAGASAGSDEDVVAWLIREHGVCVIPGSACGATGWIRVAYANITEQQCEEAAARLKAGLQQLLSMETVLHTPDC